GVRWQPGRDHHAALRRGGVARLGVRVQGGGGPVPHVGARRVRRRAGPGDGLHGRRGQGRCLRHARPDPGGRFRRAVGGARAARAGAGDDLSSWAGLSERHPGLAAAMTLFMVSLAGIPPTAGFMAKVTVFRAAIAADLVPLAVLGVLTSVAGLYYYLRVVVYV